MQENLVEKSKLFEEMLVISREELDLLKKHQEDPEVVDKLVALVDKRQQLIEAVDRLEEQGIPGVSQEELPAGYTEQFNEIQAIILSIQENDKQCRNLGQSLLNKLGKKLKETQGQKIAYQAYTQGPVETGAWFFDKKK